MVMDRKGQQSSYFAEFSRISVAAFKWSPSTCMKWAKLFVFAFGRRSEMEGEDFSW